VDEVWRPRWQRFLIYISTWVTLRLAHHSIMISTETYERARNLPGTTDRVSLVMNGIVPPKYIERGSARQTLAPALPPTATWIGGVGELHANKNWAALITAMEPLPRQTHLVIIGEGEERQALEKLIATKKLEGRVHLLGFVDAAQYLQAFDIFVLPSLKEGLPYVLLEAGAAGLPIVASKLPGIQDIITADESGLLTAPTPESLRRAIEELLHDDTKRQKLGATLQKKVLTDFSVTRMCSETLRLYSSNKDEA